MTLCLAWKSVDGRIHFASDSRVTIDSYRIDSCIKVLRIPYTIVGIADAPSVAPPEVARGDIAMAASGASMIAMMTKEALVEVLRKVQGIPGINTFGMDEIADLLFRGFKAVCGSFVPSMGARSDTTIVFAGFCAHKQALRAFKMEHLGAACVQTIGEVLERPLDIEIYGSGASHCKAALQAGFFSSRDAIDALRLVIDDPSEPTVGGNVQYGSFYQNVFVINGVAVHANDTVHYWRGPLDLNSEEFTRERGLIPLFPYLDFIGT